MKTASISATKNQLSALIERVRQGETIFITDHGRPVARLIPAGVENGQPGADELALLERKGLLRRGHGKACRLAPPPAPAKRASAVQALLEERESAR
ncbi:MAG: type II toxin-antitoxin system Phd/YefM family antitoxin [Pseudomonadota bacterium]|uniref:type II toxin-antitoxin system Phd/YefM family antitoxin n=1 Tax=Sulfuricystis thermophila TaxID=2496847 RepID=UPI0010361FA2|nr:type II toxin-antitoxin system prevent-host-death family antitoxin [Sulfuricystis thermophila]MDI6748797.1 type II toxin-antitoxin system prevent-host-death family antitoxin [Rhodocyclaceae bacterium]